MMDNVSSFARAADVVIDLLREMLDELRGMRVEVTQTLGSLRTDLSAVQAELDRVAKALAAPPDGPTKPRRPSTAAHGPVPKHAPARRR